MDPLTVNENKKNHALQAHLTHYEAIRAEINLATNAQNQIINYSIAIIAGLIAMQSFISAQLSGSFAFVFLMASMLLAFLSWAALEMEIRIHDFHKFINSTLRKRIQALIGPEDLDEYKIMKMELAEQFAGDKLRSVIRGILVVGKFALVYIPAIAFLILFFQTKPDPTGWIAFESFLVVVDIILCVFFPLGLIYNMLYVIGYYSNRADKAQKNTGSARD